MAHIALLLPTLGVGGAERVTLTLAAELLKLGDQVDIVLAQRTGGLLEAVPAGARLIALDAPRLRHTARPLAAYLARETPDALLAVMWPLTSIAVWAGRRSRTRIVVAEHNNMSAYARTWGPISRALLRPVLRWSHPRAAARIAVSHGAAIDLARLCGLAEADVAAIGNPIPLPDLARQHDAPEWGGSGRRILTVGTLKAQKNQRLLLDAFARMAGAEDRLAIVGEGEERATLTAHADALGIGQQVLMPGNAPDPGRWYASADLFVLSSDYEGLPTVLIEALGYGLTAVSTDCPSGPAEILGPGGRLVPVGDPAALANAMTAALAKPDAREVARVRAERFSPQRITALYRALLLGLAA